MSAMIDHKALLEDISTYQKLLGLDSPYQVITHLTCDTYENFLHQLETLLKQSMQHIEHCRDEYQGKSEDQITQDLLSPFKINGFNAEHDSYRSGHCDIVISYKNFEWLAEAKIHSDYNYLLQGFNQLTTRYSNGSFFSKNGGIIIYNFNQKTKNVMSNWKDHLEKNKLIKDYKEFNDGLYFTTVHEHEVSGLDYTVHHYSLGLYFNPQDRPVNKK